MRLRMKVYITPNSIPQCLIADVVLAELFVRTSHLVLTLERSAQQEDTNSSKAVVFGSFR